MTDGKFDVKSHLELAMEEFERMFLNVISVLCFSCHSTVLVLHLIKSLSVGDSIV